VQRETPVAITLVNQAETVTLGRDNIAKVERLNFPLMPSRMLDGLSEKDAVDLIAYLRSGGAR
jgi:hypothetical protein